MKKLLSYLLVAFALIIGSNASAFQIWSPSGTSDTQVVVNSATGKPILQQDSINNVNSGQPTRSFGYAFGRRSAVQNALCDLWDGPTCTYVFPAVAQQMAVSSSSAADTLAGTGAQKIHIHYLDANYAVHEEVINMNGVTPVNTVATNILRINSMHVTQIGTGGFAAGNVSLKNTGATVTYAYMSAGLNTARQAIYTVPAGVYGYISHWQASSGAISGSHWTPVYLRATTHAGVLIPGVFLVVDEIGTQSNGHVITLPIPIRVPATTDVKMSAISDASNADAQVMGAIMGWFETQ